MQIPLQAEQIKIYLRTLSVSRTVWVTLPYSKYFKPVPKDGHTYVVQDTERPSVYHCIKPNGAYIVLDNKQPKNGPGCVGKIKVSVKDLTGKVKKKAPRYSTKLTLGTSIEREPDTPPTIQLIGLERVIKTVGFKKSFIYSQPDFPSPIRLGSSRRAAVRWVAHEVEAWVQKQMAKRGNFAQASV